MLPSLYRTLYCKLFITSLSIRSSMAFPGGYIHFAFSSHPGYFGPKGSKPAIGSLRKEYGEKIQAKHHSFSSKAQCKQNISYCEGFFKTLCISSNLDPTNAR